MNYKYNIIKNLSDIRDNYFENGFIFKGKAYDKVIKNIEKINVPILNYEQIQNIDGIGKSIEQKIKDIFYETKIIENNDKLYYDLSLIYGIGPSKIKNLIEKYNISSIEDLRQKIKLDDKILTRSQKIGLECYEDLLERIPRKEMLEHQKILNLSKEKGEIVGSFRRCSENSGDIDVMLNIDIEEFNDYIKHLEDIGYLRYILSKGDKKMLGICKIKNQKFRRIDIIRNTKEEYPYTLLYFTGSGDFNISFRQHCLSLGLSLNEHGFTPSIKKLKTEKDIFKYVGLKYIEPKDRINSTSIIKV